MAPDAIQLQDECGKKSLKTMNRNRVEPVRSSVRTQSLRLSVLGTRSGNDESGFNCDTSQSKFSSRAGWLAAGADSFEQHFADAADVCGADSEFGVRDRDVGQAGNPAAAFTQMMRMAFPIRVLFGKFVAPDVIPQFHPMQQACICEIVQSTVDGRLIERCIGETFDNITVAEWRTLYLHQSQQGDSAWSRSQATISNFLSQFMDRGRP